jgi:hypothetical protein
MTLGTVPFAVHDNDADVGGRRRLDDIGCNAQRQQKYNDAMQNIQVPG